MDFKSNSFKTVMLSVIENKFAQFFFFIGMFWLVFVDLELNKNIEASIRGPHYWRQSDGLGQIVNYIKNGLNFFDFSVYYNQYNGSPKSVGEFPIFYYWIALQKTIFGGDIVFLARANSIAILMIGLFSMVKIINRFLENFLLSALISLTLFLSPVFAGYGINLFPDPIAFTFILVGLYFLTQYFDKPSKKNRILTIIFIALAGMVKLYFIIPFIAFVLVYIIYLFQNKSFKISKILWLFIPILISGSWIVFMLYYNQKYNCECFLSGINPIWNLNSEGIKILLTQITEKIDNYGSYWFLILVLSTIILNLLWWTKKSFFQNLFFVFSLIGSIIFVLLFFIMFEHHDYYIFPIFFLVILSFTLISIKLKNVLKTNKKLINILSFLLFVFIYFNLDHTYQTLRQHKETPWINATWEFENYKNLNHFLDKNHISSDKKIISFSDKTPSYSLYLLDRKGWSGYQTFYKNWDLKIMIQMGAEYLVINQNLPIMKDSIQIQGFLDYPISDTNNIYLYDLKPYHKN